MEYVTCIIKWKAPKSKFINQAQTVNLHLGLYERTVMYYVVTV